MQIRLSPDLKELRPGPVRTPMTVDEFLARFPEVSPDVDECPPCRLKSPLGERRRGT
jgi:hypothetical protein